jgi:arginine decarboxylase
MNAPLSDALAEFHRRDRDSHTPPGDRQGTGAGPRTLTGAATSNALPS